MPCIINDSQMAFMKGSKLSNVVHLVNDLISDFDSPGDLTKDYESIKRVFIISVMRKMKFPNYSLRWIKECLNTTAFEFLANG